MTQTSPYEFDILHDTAVITFSGSLGHADALTLIRRCAALPPHVVTLRLDLRPLGMMRDSEVVAVRTLLHAWRRARGGSFRLTTAHLVATCRQVVAPPAPAWCPMSHAMPLAWPTREARA